MTTIVKAADAAQFLTLVPRLVGFQPRQSIVMVPFARSRSLGAMRFDLPEPDVDVDRIAATFVGMACRVASVEAIAVVVYTDVDGEEAPPHRRLVEAIGHRAVDCGLLVTDALYVSAGVWGRYDDRDVTCSARPLAEIASEEQTGSASDQRAGAVLPSVDLAQKERVGRALDAVAEAVRLVCGPGESASESDPPLVDADGRVDPSALSAMCALDDLPALFEDALGWDAAAPAPFDIALLLWCLARPSLRDIALVQWCGDLDDGEAALDAQLRWEDGEEYPSALAMRMWGEGAVPDPARLSAALTLCRRAAASAPRRRRTGALATCAWLAWALGRSTHAEAYADEAAGIEPEHRLAEIVRSFVAAGHLPDWAFRASAERPRTTSPAGRGSSL
jgi:hypothetical protein